MSITAGRIAQAHSLMTLTTKPPFRGTVTTRSLDGRGRSKGAGVSVVGWLDERTGASPILRYQLFRKVPKGGDWWGATL
ncbi:MAG TPA: hypothetical protein VE270_06075, partial [Thermoleophilaceae bacterium]|nr:hypothetical protein [Thermoleophilaceae bacterium]